MAEPRAEVNLLQFTFQSLVLGETSLWRWATTR